MHNMRDRRATPVPVNEIGIALLLFAAASASIYLTRVPGGIALFWPGSAIAAALLIRSPYVRWISALVLTWLAVVLASVCVAHRSWGISALFGLVNSAEIMLMVLAFRQVWKYPYPNLSITQAAIMTGVFGIAIPGVTALLGGGIVHAAYDKPFLDYVLQWWASHTIGACLLGPPIVLYSRQALARLVGRRYLLENLLTLSACLLATYLLTRFVRFPFVSISLVLLMTAFRLGGFGTSILSLAVGLAITNLWALGVRPLGLENLPLTGTLVGLPVIALLATVMPPITVGIGTDARRATARALKASERRFRESMEQSPIGMVLADMRGIWTYTNIALQRMLGYSAAEFLALPPGGPSDSEDWLEGRKRLQSLIDGKLNYYDTVRRFRHKDGHWVWTHVAVSITGKDDGEPLLIAQIESMDARRQTEGRLADERQKLKVTLETISDAVVTTDVQMCITFINTAAQELLGIQEGAALGRRVDEVIYLMDLDSSKAAVNLLAQSALHAKVVRRESACLLHRPDGSMCFVSDSVSPVLDSAAAVIGFVIVFRDASHEITQALELKRRASHDPLTGLSNRSDFESRLREVFQKSHHLQRPAALLALDLDRFKAVNDTGGHAAGDAMLKRVADVCRNSVRSSDLVARLGGDEFAIILDNCSSEHAARIADKLLKSLNPLQLHWRDQLYSIGASIGVAELDAATASDQEWLARADQACYQAKREGRGALRLASQTPALRSGP